MEKLLQVRKTIKSKKPVFVQQDYHKKRRLSLRWKRPTGLHSKMRHQFKGYPARVKQGWRSPVAIRGFHGKGLKPVVVFNVNDLSRVLKEEGVIIAKNVGLKKRMLIVDKAVELGLTLLNIVPEKFKAKIEKQKTEKAESKKSKEDHKKKSLEDAVKKAKKDTKKEAKSAEQPTIEEKKAEEKKEKDDVIIHKVA